MNKKVSKTSDKLQVMQKIDSRMNPKRRRKEPTDWEIKGELFLNCSCDVFCPCVVSLGAHPPTEGHCHAWLGIIIDEGHFEGESLAGLNVGLLVDIPGRMAEGNWKVAAYVDENSTQKAYNGILKIFSGAAGGTSGLFTFLVSEIIGAERAPVEIIRDGRGRKYSYNKTTKETVWLDEEGNGVAIEEQGETKQCKKKRQSFRKIVGDDKAVFFQNVETGETVWNRPVDCELVF